MATSPSPYEPVTADEVLSAQFTHIKRGGYDTQEVDTLLDRIAATLDRDQVAMPEGSMTAEDVRTAQFTQVKRGGYDTKEVDAFLDRVVTVFGRVNDPGPDEGSGPAPAELAAEDTAPELAPEHPPVAVVAQPEPTPAPVPVAEPVPAVTAAGAPRLHDPEGAAQMLLAAAQQAADSLTGTATEFSERTRREADEYALATRTEADEHAASVTGAAEAQAAAIREMAADEARRVAEAARIALVDEIGALQARQVQLTDTNAGLESAAADGRSELLTTLDDLRARVAGELPAHASAPAAVVEASPEPPTGVAEDVEAAFAPDEPETSEPSSVEDDPAEDDPAEDDPPADLAEVVPEAAPEPEAAKLTEDDRGDDPTDDASRSVFDLADDEPGEDTSAAWLEAELDMDVAPDDSRPATTGGLFDVEADPSWEGDAPPATARAAATTQGQPSGDSFFDELRQADAQGDALGPLDDDTDAALSAFFDADDGDDKAGRWRDRFGPGKD